MYILLRIEKKGEIRSQILAVYSIPSEGYEILQP